MLPYINIGKISLPTYYTAMVLGFVMMIVVMLVKSRREKYRLTKTQSVLFATIVLILGILGCKILYTLENLSEVLENGLTFGGFSFYGSVFLIPAVIPFAGKLFGLKPTESLDNAAMCILAMLATIRFGCYLNGCCGGITVGSFTIPAQLIEVIFDVVIICLLLTWEKKGEARGFLYPRMLLLYGIVRFFIEFIRDTDKDWLFLSHAHWFSLAGITVGIVCERIYRKQLAEAKKHSAKSKKKKEK